MSANNTLLFRPTLIICVGKVGQLIREHLSPHPGNTQRHAQEPLSIYHLLDNIDTSLHQSIGLLQVATEGQGANPYNAIPFPVSTAFLDDPDIPNLEGKLETLIQESLVSVQLHRRVLEIQSRGYEIPNTRTQIFIVGDNNEANMGWMAHILGTVRRKIREFHFESSVCVLLNSYYSQDDFYDTLKRPLGKTGSKWSAYDLANFTYLFEQVMPYPSPTFLTPTEVQYATAETLLALTATGITSLPQFESEMHLPGDLEDYAHHIGSLGTSMIQFPRPAVRRYCSAKLSAELMREWRKDFTSSNISDERRLRLEQLARERVKDFRKWMRDAELRPGAEESLWPSLSILKRENQLRTPQEQHFQKNALSQLYVQTRNLFTVFAEDDVNAEYRKRKSRHWADLTYERCGRAVGLYPGWERHARVAWEAAAERAGTDVKHQVDSIWAQDDDGFENARIFVDELDDRLADLANEIVQWRQEHDTAYKNDREEFLKKARGDWNIPENASNIKGQSTQMGQAKPTMNNQPPLQAAQFTLTAAGGPGGITGVNIPVGGQGPQHLPPLEEDIALNLGRRAEWKRTLIPPLATIIPTSFLGWLSGAFAASMFKQLTQWLPWIDGGLVIALLLGGLLLTLLRRRAFQLAQEDTLAFYRRFYVHKCENREDLQRSSLMRLLRSRVLRMRQRLDSLANFFTHLEQEAQSGAEGVARQLFEGPAGVRDIFIAHGERLQRSGPCTLDSISHKVTQARLNHPQQDWHRSLSAMKRELMVRLRQTPESLLEMVEVKVHETLISFTAEVVEGYLVGPLVTISAALDKPEIWKEIFARVERPMYFASVGLGAPHLLFVCGSQADLTRSERYIPGAAIQVQTQSPEWLIVAAFFRGGEPTALDARKLFPPKVGKAGATRPNNNQAGGASPAGNQTAGSQGTTP